jgi:hypothetical protein
MRMRNATCNNMRRRNAAERFERLLPAANLRAVTGTVGRRVLVLTGRANVFEVTLLPVLTSLS